MSFNSDNPLLKQEREVAELIGSVPPETIAARVSRLRQRQGLSIRELAIAANVNKNSIVRLEKGGLPQPLTLLKICEALGVHVATLTSAGEGDGESVAIHKRESDAWFDMGDLAAGPLSDRSKVAAPMMILKSRLEEGLILPTLIELNGECTGQTVLGEEMVFVLQGAARISIGDRSFDLEEGESATFWSSEKHVYAPVPGSKIPVKLLSVSVHHRGEK